MVKFLPEALYLWLDVKKIIAVISLAAYLVFTCGVVIRSHYCMNKLASRHLFGSKSSTCSICGMSSHSNNGCCSDEFKLVKQYQDQQTLSPGNLSIPPVNALPVAYSSFLLAPLINAGAQTAFQSHSPPLYTVSDIYLEIQVFRIWYFTWNLHKSAGGSSMLNNLFYFYL